MVATTKKRYGKIMLNKNGSRHLYMPKLRKFHLTLTKKKMMEY